MFQVTKAPKLAQIPRPLSSLSSCLRLTRPLKLCKTLVDLHLCAARVLSLPGGDKLFLGGRWRDQRRQKERIQNLRLAAVATQPGHGASVLWLGWVS